MKSGVFEHSNDATSMQHGSPSAKRDWNSANASEGAAENEGESVLESQAATGVFAAQRTWPTLTMFLLSLLVPVLYVAGISTGLVDWMLWLPVAISSVFASWLSAIRIQDMDHEGEQS